MALFRTGRTTLFFAAALVAGLTVQSCSKGGGVNDGSNWASYGGTSDETHFSPLDQVNDGNIDKLGLAWSYDLDTFDSYTAPLAVDGVLYFGVGHSVLHALDARTGKLLWQYDPDVAGQEASKMRMRAGWGIRGIAYKDGKVFTGTRDGRLIAVDAKNGKLLWSVQTLDEAENGYITGPPWIAGDKVVIGFGGADYAPVRGYVTAYDINSGRKAWRFHVVPGNPANGGSSAAAAPSITPWPMTRNTIASIWARAMAGRGTPGSAVRKAATTSISPPSSRSMRRPGNMSGTIRPTPRIPSISTMRWTSS
jgi:quinohemoprotein ethanol dehydrogenase